MVAAMRLIVFALLSVTGCAAQQPAEPLWKRADGQSVDGTPGLRKQADMDLAICDGEKAKVYASARVEGYGRQVAMHQAFAGCMAERGYVRAN